MYSCWGSPSTSAVGAGLDDAARRHDVHPVGAVGDHADVVADQEHAEPEPLLEVVDEVETCACTETSSAVVGSSATSSRGRAGERQRDDDPLVEAAGQLVRERVQRLVHVVDADEPQQVLGPLARLAPRCPGRQRLEHLRDDPQPGVERRRRVLEHDPQVVGEVGVRAARSGRSSTGPPRPPRRAAPCTSMPQGSRPGDRERGERLAGAGLPTIPTVSPSRTSRSTPWTSGSGRPVRPTVRPRTASVTAVERWCGRTGSRLIGMLPWFRCGPCRTARRDRRRAAAGRRS